MKYLYTSGNIARGQCPVVIARRRVVRDRPIEPVSEPRARVSTESSNVPELRSRLDGIERPELHAEHFRLGLRLGRHVSADNLVLVVLRREKTHHHRRQSRVSHHGDHLHPALASRSRAVARATTNVSHEFHSPIRNHHRHRASTSTRARAPSRAPDAIEPKPQTGPSPHPRRRVTTRRRRGYRARYDARARIVSSSVVVGRTHPQLRHDAVRCASRRGGGRRRVAERALVRPPRGRGAQTLDPNPIRSVHGKRNPQSNRDGDDNDDDDGATGDVDAREMSWTSTSEATARLPTARSVATPSRVDAVGRGTGRRTAMISCRSRGVAMARATMTTTTTTTATTRGTRAREVRAEAVRGRLGATETSRATSGRCARGEDRGGARGDATARAAARRKNASEYAAATTSKGGGGSAFERAGGLLYVRNFFEPETYERVAKECAKLRESVTAENRACARHRLGVMVPTDNFVHEACVASSVAERLGTLLLGEENEGDLVAGDVPVEFRIYPVGGSMEWHKDVALYSKPQFEIVFTVTNTSDSTTEWEDERTGMRYGGWTEPNSVIVVRADGAPHRVTAVTRGERSIVKFVLTQTLEKTDDFFDNLLTYTH